MWFDAPGIYFHEGETTGVGLLISTAENTRFHLVMDGLFFEEVGGHKEAEVALMRFEEGGVEALAGTNGNFNIIIHDKFEKRTLLVSDVLATRPWYFYRKGNTFAVSPVPSFFAEKGLAMSFNRQAAYETLVHNYTINNHLLVNELSRNRPVSYCVHGDGILKEVPVWVNRNGGHPQYTLIEDMADRIHEILRNNLASIVSKRGLKELDIQLTLTGGFDSRHILGELLKLSNPPALVRHIDLQEIDRIPVEMIAKSLDIPLKVTEFSRIDFQGVFEHWLKVSSGLLNFHQAYLFEPMLNKPRDIMFGFDGYLMDSLLGIRPKFDVSSLTHPSDGISSLRYTTRADAAAIFQDARQLEEASLQLLRERETKEEMPASLPHAAMLLQLSNRSLKYTGAAFPLTGDGYLSFAPGACADSLDFLFNSAWEVGMHNKARIRMLEKYHPELDAFPSIYGITYSQLGRMTTPLPPSKTPELENRIRLRNYGYCKRAKHLVPMLTRGLWEPVREGEHFWLRGVPQLRNLMDRFSRDSLLEEDGVISGAGLRKIWKAHKAGGLKAWTLMNLFTLEAAYRALVKRQHPQVILDRFLTGHN